jgi:hypothetical protein
MAANVLRSRRVKKVAASVLLAAAASIGAMGFLHTKWGKPLLMKLGGCPVGNVSAEELEKLRNQTFVASEPATKTVPPSVYALGFELDHTTMKDVMAWGSSHGISCDDSREGTVVVCANVPSKALSVQEGSELPLTELTFGFRKSDNALYTVTGWRQDLTPEDAAAAMAGIGEKVTAKLGQPHKMTGEPSTAYLSGDGMRTAVMNYSFTGYTVSVAAVKMPSGVWLREVYVSTKVNDTPAQGS